MTGVQTCALPISSSVMESSRFNPTPMNERASGFGRATSDSGDTMKTITPIDAEIVEEDGMDEDMGPDISAAPTGKVSYDQQFCSLSSFSCRTTEQQPC